MILARLFNTCLFTLIGIGISCGQSSTANKFTVKGTVKNAIPGEYIYLERAQQSLVKVDSVKLDKSGTFTMKASEDSKGSVYHLNVGNKHVSLLLIEGGETLNVITDRAVENTEGMHLASTVTGSKNMEYFQKLLPTVVSFNNRMKTANQEATEAQAKKDNAKLAQLQEEMMGKEKLMLEEIKGLLPAMGSSFVSVFVASNFLNPQVHMNEMVQVMERLESANNSAPYAKSYISTISRMKGVSIGDQAPDFSLPSPNGGTVSLSSLKGKYVLIDFWASWCGPCRAENPNVVAMYNKYKSKNFEIIGVSLDKNEKAWLDAINKDKLTWVHGSDLKGWESAVGRLYSVTAIPITYLLDKNGVVIAKNLRGAALEAKVAELVKSE